MKPPPPPRIKLYPNHPLHSPSTQSHWFRPFSSLRHSFPPLLIFCLGDSSPPSHRSVYAWKFKYKNWVLPSIPETTCITFTKLYTFSAGWSKLKCVRYVMGLTTTHRLFIKIYIIYLQRESTFQEKFPVVQFFLFLLDLCSIGFSDREIVIFFFFFRL